MKETPRIHIKSTSLRFALARQNKTLKWLAHRISVSPQYLTMLLNETRFPSPGMRDKIMGQFAGSPWDRFFYIKEKDKYDVG